MLDPELSRCLAAAGIQGLDELCDPRQGREVVTHRSSWVRQLDLGTAGSFFIKTYNYATWNDRLRGLGRTTWLAPSRADREARAYKWLARNGFVTPRQWFAWDQRQLGMLRRAALLSAAVPGDTLEQLLPCLAPPAQVELLGALGAWVSRLHALGFRDRNLDLRNIVATTSPRGWSLAKIDAPRWRRRGPDRTPDRLCTQDWARLEASIRTLGLDPRPLRGR